MNLTSLRAKTKAWLIFLQRYTKTDNLYLAKGGFWIVLATIASNILGIILTIIFTRLSTKDIFGQYQTIFALINTFLIVSLPSIDTAVTEAVARGLDKSVLVGLKERLRFSLLGSLIFIGLAVYTYFAYESPLFTAALFVVAIFFPVYSINNIIFSYYYAKKDFRFPNLFHIVNRMFIIGALTAIILIWNNIFAIIFVYLAVQAAANLILLWWFKQNQDLKGEADPGILIYGLQLTAGRLIPDLLNSADKLIISVFLGVEALAIYAIAEKIPNVIKGFLKSLTTLFFPKFVHLDKVNFINKFKNPYLFLVIISGTIITAIALPTVMPLLFGSTYNDSINLGRIYLLLILPFILYDIVLIWFQAQKMAKAFFYANHFFTVGGALLMLAAVLIYKTLLALVVARIIISFLAFILGLQLAKKS